MFEYKKGIRILGSDFWLDPAKIVPFAFVSHAHADHIRRHKKAIATPPTIKLFKHRLGNRTETIELDFGIKYFINDIAIELFPSGHILGAAQIFVEKNDLRLVYTGDLNPRISETAEKMEYRETDILIIETTFGLPQYKFPPKIEAINKLCGFVDKCLKTGVVPVIMSYALGKSQEVIKILGDKGYHVIVYKSIYEITKLYEECGIKFRNWKKYEGDSLHNSVIIIPPRLKNWIAGLYKGGIRKAIVTGWAIDNNCKYRYGADEAIPLSDHADFYDLIDYVNQVNPQKIYVTHGFREFIHYLNKEGFTAQELETSSQLTLF